MVLMAIYRKKLEVKVQDKIISRQTLSDFIELYGYKAKNAYNYYRVLTNSDGSVKFLSTDFQGMGTIMGKLRLRVLVSSSEDLNKKLLVVRKTGMKLFDMKGISRSISFTGILELEGQKLNEYFRKMETAAHDKWDPNLHWDRSNAKIYKKRVEDWVKDKILELGKTIVTDEVEVEGLSDILQIDNVSNNKMETLSDNLKLLDVVEIDDNDSGSGKLFSKTSGDDGPYSSETPGYITNKGNDPAVRTLKGTRKRKKKVEHRGIEAEDGPEIIKKRTGAGVKLKYARIIKTDTKSYQMIFEIPKTIYKGNIEIMTVGENGKYNKLNVTSANAVQSCSDVQVVNDNIKVVGLSNSSRVKINFSLQDNIDYAMEIKLYENN